MNELTIAVDSIPALIDAVMRDLSEARDIEAVREIHDRAEALRIYTRSRGAAIEAQNGCQKLVLLCERRIGEELANIGMGSGVHRANQRSAGSEAPRLKDLGISSDKSSEYQRLARTPVAAIEEREAMANTESRRLTRADIAKVLAPSRQGKKRPKLHIVADELPDALVRVQMWLRAASTMLSGTGEEITSKLAEHGHELTEADVLPAYLRAKGILEAVRERAARAA